jgi:hypothetical protein
MRVAIFVAVVAAHIALLWFFPSLRRVVLSSGEDEPPITAIFPPVPSNQIASSEPPSQSASRAEESVSQTRQQQLRRAAGRSGTPEAAATSEIEATPDVTAMPGSDSQQSPLLEPPSSHPDWRAQAEATARTSAKSIVAAEDDAARKVAALTARFKPLPGPRVRGPEFGWDYAATHRITHVPGGGLVVALNDRCAILIFLIPMIGCSVGPKPPANGDLFKYMHKPVKFGDWDWRVDDP